MKVKFEMDSRKNEFHKSDGECQHQDHKDINVSKTNTSKETAIETAKENQLENVGEIWEKAAPIVVPNNGWKQSCTKLK